MSIEYLEQNVSVERIEDFLNCSLPNGHDFSFSEMYLVSPNSIGNFIAERPPQRYIERVAIDVKGSRVFATYTITDDNCDGHIHHPITEKKYPMMPMAIIGQMMAQGGSILAINSIDEKSDFKNPSSLRVALVKNVQEIESRSVRVDHKLKIFLVPDDTVLIMAELKSARIATVSCNTTAYLQGKPITIMPLTYEVLSWDAFARLYERTTS